MIGRPMRPPRPVIAALLVAAAAVPAAPGLAEPQQQQRAGAFRLVGHNPLFNRGMNAAMAIHGDYAYIGSRTDGKPGNENLTHGGVVIVDISDPADPVVANEIGPPLEGNAGESSRELRVWRSQNILIVLHTNCGTGNAHVCQIPSRNSFRFYDISGANAADPKLIRQFDRNTHEFFLWEDPTDPKRALMFGGSAGSQMQVWDLSPLLQGGEPSTLYEGPHGYPEGGIHSLSVSNDGTRAYFALLTGGFAVADVSDFATAGVPDPEPRPITSMDGRPTWPGPGAHSAIKLWGRDWVYVSDEVYGSATGADHGCPWGWARMIDISDPTTPVVAAEYKVAQNHESFCEGGDTRPFTSFAAHNPTATENIVFTTWHSAGVQAIDVSNPAAPTQLAEFLPEPLSSVTMEDPRLSAGEEKVVMWSFPIIKDGLIYVVDLRNGLYVLDYAGAGDEEVESVTFLEGNSNQGHALCYEPVGKPPTYCDVRRPRSGGGPYAICERLAKTKLNVIFGTAGNDVLRGTPGPDAICGGPRRDVIRGGDGGDILVGGRGRDRLLGAGGGDRLQAGKDNDRLIAGAGRDRLVGHAGKDRCNGGSGRDRFKGCEAARR
jgi:hypothetical protein